MVKKKEKSKTLENLGEEKIGIIIQARTGSTRLPEKVIKPFYQGQSILDLLIDSLKALPYFIVVATTKEESDDRIVEIARRKKVAVSRGSEHNVLQRFVEAADAYQLDWVLRVCSDNPFLSVSLLESLLEEASKQKFAYDYFGFSYRGKIGVLTHFGVFAELVSLKALREVLTLTDDPIYLEHVTNYIYQHPTQFRVYFLDLPADTFMNEDIRLTVDTANDFNITSRLYNELMRLYGNTSLEAINQYLLEHPGMLRKMIEEKKENPK